MQTYDLFLMGISVGHHKLILHL